MHFLYLGTMIHAACRHLAEEIHFEGTFFADSCCAKGILKSRLGPNMKLIRYDQNDI